MTDFFARLVAESPTRVWVNNPTLDEIDLALANGAVGCTTNPAYGGGLARRAPAEVIPLVDSLLAQDAAADDHAIADRLQERLVMRIAKHFQPLHEASGGTWGYVSIQGSPETDMDGERIWEEARSGRALGVNVAPKIPATVPGMVAFERVVEAGWPVIITEVFSLDQLVTFCEAYLAIVGRTGSTPRFFMSPITGILGDHLKKIAARDGLAVPPAVLEQAGIGLARRCSALVVERHYPVTLLFGGARIPEDLTGLVGRPECATVNWSTFAEVLALDPAVARTIDQSLDPAVEGQLLDMFPDLRMGWQEGRLRPEQYEGFGPVQHFRDAFLAGWHAVLALVAERRSVTLGVADRAS
jgi:transaldolase